MTIFYDFLHRNDRLPGTGTGAFFTVPVPPKFSGSGSATLVWPGAESVILNEAAPAMLLELGTYYLIKITLHYQIRNFNPFFFKFSKKFVFNPIQIRVLRNFMKSPIQILKVWFNMIREYSQIFFIRGNPDTKWKNKTTMYKGSQMYFKQIHTLKSFWFVFVFFTERKWNLLKNIKFRKITHNFCENRILVGGKKGGD